MSERHRAMAVSGTNGTVERVWHLFIRGDLENSADLFCRGFEMGRMGSESAGSWVAVVSDEGDIVATRGHVPAAKARAAAADLCPGCNLWLRGKPAGVCNHLPF